MYYAWAVHNRILVGLSAIGAKQASATEQTVAAIDQTLDHIATYPNDGITYRASDTILAAHSDAGFKNESKAHIFLSENDPTPEWNSAILTIAQIIKFSISSAAEVELGVLQTTAKELVPIRQTLLEMGWKQPPSPIQTNNSTAAGVLNKTIIQRKRKFMELRFHWLRCGKPQEQFRFYWAPGHFNWGDYCTNHHIPIYHTNHRPRFSGYVNFSKITKTSMKRKNIYLILDHFSRVTARMY